ncbi:hypothetical protein FQN54_004222 [Arachnomyces sp. PD_36]|nr:hypothetical protein FQN54_004222 [Arachnomyces sp. PD_36]
MRISITSVASAAALLSLLPAAAIAAATPNEPNLDTTIDLLSDLKPLATWAERTEAYHNAPEAAQHKFWVNKINEFRDENIEHLNKPQLDALDAALDLFTTRDFAGKEEDAVRKAVEAFGRKAAKELLGSVGGENERMVEVEVEGELEKRQAYVCDCCAYCTDLWCGSESCLTWDCVVQAASCGSGYAYDCNGVCGQDLD